MRSSTRGLWIALVVIGVVALVAMPMYGMGMMWARPGLVDGAAVRPVVGAMTFWGVEMLVRVLFWGLAIWLVVSLFRGRGRTWGGWSRGPYDESADEILRRRYASGEITREQFEEMRQHLNAGA